MLRSRLYYHILNSTYVWGLNREQNQKRFVSYGVVLKEGNPTKENESENDEIKKTKADIEDD